MRKVLMIGGRERCYFLIEKMLKHNLPLHGFIIMKDDEHEMQWSEKIADLLKEKNIPCCIGKSFSSNKLINFFQEISPTIVLVENWRTLIPTDIVSKVKYMVVFHESLLPKYRGFAPLAWPIINDESETGVSMFFISDRVDAGDVIGQKKISISEQDTSYDLFLKTYDAYWNLINTNLLKLVEGKVDSYPQDEQEATYACMRTPEDGYINWNNTTRSIFNLIRALAPPFLPGAFSFYDGKKVILVESSIPSLQPNYAGRIPGKIVEIDKDRVSVLTGDGVINIHQVSVEGEVLSAPLFLNKMKIKLL